ncbi:OmcA/MtrC family decaheme c-type cytochrome [Geoalkalibacter subterraneus]|uniref:Cytochrome c domain-containing protein n=1 Tax=Geoalkalibacter subterraneus TaxID=483547 RepID=A0A0B5FMB9_9BACT|nr:OmcA/MtrC family decaheme c-type cytochrome [Geoalkalibacter subterraneus]AJF05799.1 hypothetical protein GSUB_03345 [Geoalkalibacter subterraneus]
MHAEFTIAKWVPEAGTWVSMLQRDRQTGDNPRVIRAGNLRKENDSALSPIEEKTFQYTYTDGDTVIDFSNGAYWTSPTSDGSAPDAEAFGCSDISPDYCNFVAGILADINTFSTWEAGATYRVAVTSRTGDSRNGDYRFNALAHFQFDDDGNVTLVGNPHKIMDIASCASCHGTAATAFNAHGSQRHDPNVCANCHNDFTFDRNESVAEVDGWFTLSMTNMIHGIHAGIEDFQLDGKPFQQVRYPDWTFGRTPHPSDETPYPGNPGVANCVSCHKGRIPTANQLWNKVKLSACTSCHTDRESGTNAFHYQDSDCTSCHSEGDIPSAEEFHQVGATLDQLAAARSYQMEILSIEGAVTGSEAKVTWRVLKDGVYQDIFEGEDIYLEKSVRLGIGWGYGDDWTNDGSGVSSNGDAGRPFQVEADSGNTAPVDGDNTTAVTTFAVLPDGAMEGRNGFVVIERGPAGINASSVVRTFTLGSGLVEEFGERRQIVSTENCLSCHNTIGRHGTTADNDIMACVTCHNAGSLSRDGSTVQGTVDFMYIMHAIHGVGEKRGKFDRRRDHIVDGVYDGGYTHVTYPNTVVDCNACHINDSHKFPVDPKMRLGVIGNEMKNLYANGSGVNGPTASVCYSCHEITDDELADRVLRGHMTAEGGDMFGGYDHIDYFDGFPVESCTVCHE